MPIMDGIEAATELFRLKEVGQISRLPPILAHTAFTDPKIKERCFEIGMCDFIPKPTD